MKKYIYILGLFIFLTYNNVFCDANSLFWIDKVDNSLKAWWNDIVSWIDNIAGYLIWLFYFISVLIWIYGWFIILTSWWEEDKVKKWKNIIIFMVIWLIVVFLASQLVRWVISIMSNQSIVWNL